MYNLLKGKKGIIFGALDSKSIAWKVAERAHEEGATFVLTNAPVALRLGTIAELAEKTGFGQSASRLATFEPGHHPVSLAANRLPALVTHL